MSGPSSIPGPALGSAERVDTAVGPLWFRADDDVMRPAVIRTGWWERGEAQLLQQLVKPGARVLDVGAHIGYFGVVAHRAAGGVRIDAVEPDPFSARLCELNLFAAGASATVWTCGLGAVRDTLAFESSEHNPGDSRVVERATSAGVVVPVVPADELFPDGRFDVVKIDVQGFEREVILGMQGIIRRSHGVKVLVEFFPGAIADAGRRPIDTLTEYQAMGFTVEALVGDQLRSMSFDEIITVCTSSGPQGFVTLLLRRG
ncbi:MAG: FkbM family methyltransferase [Acidimicrobiales bacterium]